MLARRTIVALEYAGVDITEDIEEDLLSFSYTDNASGAADDVSITLEDKTKKWIQYWMPQKGDIVKPEIQVINQKNENQMDLMPCGVFTIDQPEFNGKPRTLTLNAISIPGNGNFMSVKRTKGWRNITLKKIAEEIVVRYGIDLYFESDHNPTFTEVEQTDTPDAGFLQEICEKEGLAFKVSDSKIVIFDEAMYEKQDPVERYSEIASDLLNYSFRSTYTDTAYAGCNVKYYDPELGKQIEYLFALKEIDPEKDKVYQLNARVKTGQEAKILAQKTLRKLNKHENTCRLTVVGNPRVLASSCIELTDFGMFSGKYYIERAIHRVESGYVTEIEGRKVLEGV